MTQFHRNEQLHLPTPEAQKLLKAYAGVRSSSTVVWQKCRLCVDLSALIWLVTTGHSVTSILSSDLLHTHLALAGTCFSQYIIVLLSQHHINSELAGWPRS